MALLEPRESKKDVNVRTAQLVRLLVDLGPDIPEISRRLGQFKESVRYRYKEKIINKGFSVQAVPDHEKLGLKRIVLVVDFANEFRDYGQTILTAMNKNCYVVGFEKTLPHGEYVVSCSVPVQEVAAFTELMYKLRDMGIFVSCDVLDFEWFRNSPMKPEFYDFDTGRWDFDWSNANAKDLAAANFARSDGDKFDEVDLQLIEQLQIDANKSLKEISDRLNINYKKLAWHFATHVTQRRLIRGYRINWMGTGLDLQREKAKQRQHRYFVVVLLVKDATEIERMTLRQRVNQLPFLWAEASGRNYAAEFAFPVEAVTEAFQYLEDTIGGVRDRAEIFTIDQTNSIAFAVPRELYNGETKSWMFNKELLTSQFENMIIQLREANR